MNLPLNIDIQQIFLHMFNFIILTGGMYFLLYKPVKDFMDKRKAYYEGIELETKEKMSQANLLKEKYEQQLSGMQQEIARKKADAAREIEQSKEAELSLTKKKAQEILEDARIQGEKEKERILAEAQGEIAEMAAAATQKLLYASGSEAFDEFLNSVEGSVKDE